MQARVPAIACLCLCAGTALADPVTIDFETDGTGARANGFQSLQSSLVSFSDTLGADMQLNNFGSQGDGNSLAIFGDDASQLEMSFSTTVDSLQLSFGNDDPNFSNPGDRARLQVFDGMTMVGEVFVTMDRDDVMNQTILASGFGLFDRALFAYVDGFGNAIGLIEVVDNINFNTAGEVIPLPTAGSMGLAGLLIVGARRRRPA